MIYTINEIAFMFLPFFIVACVVEKREPSWLVRTVVPNKWSREILFGFSHYLLPIRRFGYCDKNTM